MILVVKPLRYKRLITRKRLHIGFWSLFTSCIVYGTILFIYFRQDKFILFKHCRLENILQRVAYLAGPVLYFIIVTIILIANYSITTYKLKVGCSVLATQPNAMDVNVKMIKALWLVLSSLILLHLPFVTVCLFMLFTHPPYPENILITQDVCNLIVSLNNVINPFLYYMTMKEFRTGYTDLLPCGKRVENSIV